MKRSITFGGTSDYNGFEIFDSRGIVVKTSGFKETFGDRLFRAREVLTMRLDRENNKIWKTALLIVFLTATVFFLIGCFSSAKLFLSASLALVALAFLAGFVSVFLDMLVPIVRMAFVAVGGMYCPGGHKRFNCPECNEKLFEWHACEHKLIHILESGREVSFQTIKEAVSYDEHCGCGEGDLQRERLREPSVEKILETVEAGKRYLALVGNRNLKKQKAT